MKIQREEDAASLYSAGYTSVLDTSESYDQTAKYGLEERAN